jgi:hypothetical protein
MTRPPLTAPQWQWLKQLLPLEKPLPDGHITTFAARSKACSGSPAPAPPGAICPPALEAGAVFASIAGASRGCGRDQRRLGHGNLVTTQRYLEALESADNPYGEHLAVALGLLRC